MRIIDRSKEIENDTRMHEEIKSRLLFHQTHTGFGISLLFLIFEGLAPSLILYFLTSPDVDFRISTYELAPAIGFSIVTLVGIIGLSTLTFWLKWHRYDQLIYNFTICMVIVGFYITGFWWTNWSNIVYRCLIALLFLLIGVTVSTMLALLIRNGLGLLEARRTNDFSNVATMQEIKEEIKKEDDETQVEQPSALQTSEDERSAKMRERENDQRDRGLVVAIDVPVSVKKRKKH